MTVCANIILTGRRWSEFVCNIQAFSMCMANIHFNVIVPSLLKCWKRLENGLGLSADAFITLSKRFKKQTKGWLTADKATQRTRPLSGPERSAPKRWTYMILPRRRVWNIYSSDKIHTYGRVKLHLVQRSSKGSFRRRVVTVQSMGRPHGFHVV